MKNQLLQQCMLLCLVLISLLAPGRSSAADVKDGFRDARLGAKLTSFKGMILTSTSDGQQLYERASDNLTMGKGTLKSIIYCFEKGVLVDIHLKAAAGANGKAISEEITSVQGAPTQQTTIMGSPVRYWRTPAMLLTYVEGPQIRVSYALFSSLKKGS
ncbi:hypothetical protein Q5H92_23960 [Hymenobacter sp. M29]|uniref:Uncharacterized protein n=1 Tax=Hymenobacter mellowenesis TaxID=3063995 RepID=A0ABT9AK49_9BACT|nr:hypothetical protein [Hymenobacter sp. M29]MDO7849441.1 hypothetical protein [Hymenobacter sp. M29]